MLKELKGRQGKSLVLNENSVVIIKKGKLFSASREKNLPIRNICGVEVKKPGAFITGYIQFSIGGGQHLNSSFSLTGGAYSAAQDENSIMFDGKENYNIALEIKEYIDNYTGINQNKSDNRSSDVDDILKYKKLLDEGVITKEEFEIKKKQLLNL